jgi:enoyl-CoA hydratase/carnithine racemase
MIEGPPEGRGSDSHALVGAERQGPVLRLTLQNPPANALSVEVIELLRAELDAARNNDAVHVIVLAAAGKLFSAGHDLREMASHRADPDRGKRHFEDVFELCSSLMLSIVNHPKPVIAEVDGIATAAGCQLVASCDLAITSDKSRFGVNGVDVGLFCATPAVALTRNISRKRAMDMLLTGKMIDAAMALEYSLVNRVVPSDQLTKVVSDLAGIIASKSTVAVKLGKAAVNKQAGMGTADAYQHTSCVMVENMLAADAEEGISAFLEKRKPRWLEDD